MTPWTVACQSPLSVGFSTPEYWSGLPFPLGYSQSKDQTQVSCTVGRFFTELRGKPPKKYIYVCVCVCIQETGQHLFRINFKYCCLDMKAYYMFCCSENLRTKIQPLCLPLASLWVTETGEVLAMVFSVRVFPSDPRCGLGEVLFLRPRPKEGFCAVLGTLKPPHLY